ncbi:MAG: hypothetical protein LQ344_001214 [Seirophora lacunosa]|nr:MAG: hypothetical protein LQ344_001214 [Seirophora lacunosa]
MPSAVVGEGGWSRSVGLDAPSKVARLSGDNLCPRKGHTASTVRLLGALLLVVGIVPGELQRRQGLAAGTIALGSSGLRQGLEIQDLVREADQKQALHSAEGTDLREDDEELQEFDPKEFKDETGESEDDEAPPPAVRITHSPVEFDPMEIKDETGEGEEEEAPPPRWRLGRISNSETADEEERVLSGGSHPPAMARHGVDAPADLDHVRPDPSMDEMDEEFRQALAASLAEAQVVSTDVDADLEEQFRAAMEASMFDAEEQIRRIIEASQREHEEEERQKARRRQQYEELQVLLGASQRIVSESGIQDDQDELAMVLSLSEAAYAEDVHRRAARMAHESPQTASWTETSQANQQRGPPGVALPPVIPTSLAEGTPQRATTTTPIRNPSQCARDNSLPSQHPLNPNGKIAITESNNAVIPGDKATSSQALIVRPPPIDPPALIALCEKAFPEDVDISAALAASRRTATISSIQNADLDFDPILASTIAESLASAQANAADATDIGLAEPPPSYHFSIDKEESRQIDHFRYTTADYRRERPAGRKPITPPIRTIMRLWREFLTWEAEYGVADANGRRKASPFGPLPPPPSSPSTDDHPQRERERAQQQQLAPPPPPPPEIASRLDATHRPPLRSDLAIACPTEQTSRFMSASLTPERRASALRMQAQSRAISQSGLAGHRPRRPPEAHMEPFGRLPIVREELPPVAAAGGREGGRGRGRRRGI